MANLAVWVTSVSLTEVSTLNDSFFLSGTCQADGGATSYAWTVTSPVASGASVLNLACIAAAVAVMASHGVAVGSGDTTTLIGGGVSPVLEMEA